MATFTVKRNVKLLAFANCVQSDFLLGRLGNWRNFDVRIREWRRSAKLEGVEALGTALRFGRGHGARGRKQARTGTTTHGSDYVLLALHRKSNGDRVDSGLGLNEPEFLAGVRGVSG